MRKKILCLVMAAFMTVGTAFTAYAEDFQGESGWTVDFDGDKMNSNFKSSQMTDEIYRIQPGDSIELQVAIKNSSDVQTDWYMTNEVLESLEESQSVAEGGAYTYTLTYRDVNNQETVLYSSEAVGGEENPAGAGEGLHQATDSLEDYFYLDRLDVGESGSVHLTVKLDGETQGNAYQDTLARLQMNFAVEKVAAATTVKTTTPKSTTSVRRIIRSNPKTGDTSFVLTFCAAALVSGIVLLVLGLNSLKKRSQNKKGEMQS